jgi:N-acyl amino acid synthase of PEP-CTERM/exosortase system
MFDRTYEVILADTEISRAIHRKIRYHVYCLENPFENPADFPWGEEYDPWDNDSAQFIVRNRPLGTWVAAMRLVLPHCASFPIEKLPCLTSNTHLPRRQLAEVSRISTIRSLNPWEMNPYLDRNYGNIHRNGESEILLGLLRTLFVYGGHHGLEYGYLLITDALARLVRRFGVVLHRVGTSTHHRGLRTPYLVERQETIKSMSAQSGLLREMLGRQTLGYRPFSALSATNAVLAPLQPSTLPLAHALPIPETAWRARPPVAI